MQQQWRRCRFIIESGEPRVVPLAPGWGQGLTRAGRGREHWSGDQQGDGLGDDPAGDGVAGGALSHVCYTLSALPFEAFRAMFPFLSRPQQIPGFFLQPQTFPCFLP